MLKHLQQSELPIPTATSTTLLLLTSLLVGCNGYLPKMPEVPTVQVFKIDIAQGNIIDADALGRLALGMSQKSVRLLLGTPLIIDPFNANRWDYIYNFQPGGEERQQRQVTLLFDDQGQLTEIGGDVVGELRTRPMQVARGNITVSVPPRETVEKKGFWHNLRLKVPFVGGEEDTTPQHRSIARVAAAQQGYELISAPQQVDSNVINDQLGVMESATAPAPSFTLSAGQSLADIEATADPEIEPEVTRTEQPLDDKSGLFDGLLRKIGG